MTSNAVSVVLGARGGAGSALVRELSRQGQSVRAVTRGQPGPDLPGVEWLRADVTNAAEVAQAAQGAGMVYHAAQPPYHRWPEEFPAMNAAVVQGAAQAGAKLVVIDNLYMYGPVDGPLREGLPETATTRKGRVRADLTRELLRAHREGQLPVAVARFADYFGPGVTNSLASEAFFAAVLRGEPPVWFGRADLPHSLTFIDDLARAAVLVGGREDAYGQVWHVPTDTALSAQQLADLAAQEAGVGHVLVNALPIEVVRALSAENPVMGELEELRYQVEAPFVVDGTRFGQTFDFGPTSNREAVRWTLAWVHEHGAVTA